jgi:hypothetical protein
MKKDQALSRRSFLKAGVTTGSALHLIQSPEISLAETGVSPALRSHAEGTRLLPAVPKPADLASDRLVHHLHDYFNPPQGMNEFGSFTVHKSISAITAIAFPPFACCGIPEMPFSPGNLVTCELFLNGEILANHPAPAGNVAYTWYPHKVLREMRISGLSFTTETFLPGNQRAVVESIRIKNETGERRHLKLGFDLRAGVIATSGKPWYVNAPGEGDNRITPDSTRGCLVFEARHSRAVSVQGIAPHPDRIEQQRMLIHELSLGPGEEQTLRYVNAIGEQADVAIASYDRLQANFDELARQKEAACTHLLRSAFTPGNSEFSGHLPQLHTTNAALWKLYYNGFAGIIFCRRLSPDSAYGPTYITLSRAIPTQSFIWDTMLTSLSLSLLDPAVLRSMVEVWLARDMDAHRSTDYLTGQAVWPWYGVNDMGILRCADNLLRVSGDVSWLDKVVEGKPVIDHLVDHAFHWKKLVTGRNGLADYGDMAELLEVVSTYIHEVPALNAGNVYGMRFVASLLESRGEGGRASQLWTEARELAERINRILYVNGKGWWKCGQPDGTFNDVRHSYDLLTILDTMAEDLSESQKKEMSNFFWTELHTPLWMHALSAGDPDATWNVRADHSWLGAYTAWPSMTAKGLFKIDDASRVAEWIKGLAKSGNQGPYGQAHVVESVFPPEMGGALKSPWDLPYGNDWSELSGGSFTDMVIDSIFGANFTLNGGIKLHSRLLNFDPGAELRNVNYHGKLYTINQNGVQPA